MNAPLVIRNVDRLSPDLVSALEKYGVSTVHEAQGRRGLLATYMRPIYAGAASPDRRSLYRCRLATT